MCLYCLHLHVNIFFLLQTETLDPRERNLPSLLKDDLVLNRDSAYKWQHNLEFKICKRDTTVTRQYNGIWIRSFPKHRVWEYDVCACVFSRLVMSDALWPHGLQPARLLCPWDFPGKNTGVGCHFLLQRGISFQGRCIRLLCHFYITCLHTNNLQWLLGCFGVVIAFCVCLYRPINLSCLFP